nr:Arc family DNA-binding protein [Microvirga zambiensis]
MNATAPSRDLDKLVVRLPDGFRHWLKDQADRNGSSQNSEVIRSIRERMDRVAAGEGPRQAYPAAETQPVSAG